MASPLLDSLRRLVVPELLAGASSALGEPERALAKGLDAAFPALLAPLADRSGDPNVMQRLLSLVNDPALDGNLLTHPARGLDALAHRDTGPAALAAALLPLALGDRTDATESALARHAGLANASHGGSLLALATPLVLALLRERCEREGLGAPGLGRWLGSQREALHGALPPGLERAVAPSRVAPASATPARPSWTVPLALVLGLVALWALLRGERAPAPAVRSEPPPVAAPPPSPEAGRLTTVSLPGGGALDVPAGSLEVRLAHALESGGGAGGQPWLAFDGLLFETGSARLAPGSRPQLANVARILDAYPAARLEIGGYAGAVGDPAGSRALAQARAESVRDALTQLGVAPERLAARAWGPDDPPADDAGESARERGIALRVAGR